MPGQDVLELALGTDGGVERVDGRSGQAEQVGDAFAAKDLHGGAGGAAVGLSRSGSSVNRIEQLTA